jgi:hypothetical protein
LQTGNRRKLKELEVNEDCTQKEWNEALFKMLLANNIAFHVVANQAFRKCMRMLKPSIKVPSPSGVRLILTRMYGRTVETIKEALPPDVKLSFTADCWSSTNKIGFLGILMYWLDKDWNMQEALIGFDRLTGKHTGAYLATIFLKVLDR